MDVSKCIDGERNAILQPIRIFIIVLRLYRFLRIGTLRDNNNNHVTTIAELVKNYHVFCTSPVRDKTRVN